MNCENRCVANVGGQCVADKCQGEIRMLTKPNTAQNPQKVKRLYEGMIKMFQEDFEDA